MSKTDSKSRNRRGGARNRRSNGSGSEGGPKAPSSGNNGASPRKSKPRKPNGRRSGGGPGPRRPITNTLEDAMESSGNATGTPRQNGSRRRSGNGQRRPGQGRPGGNRRTGGRARGGSNGRGPQQRLTRVFEMLHQTVSIDPEEPWRLSRDDGSLTPRVIDLIAPLGKGQRCLIVAPPKAGKTTLLLEIARSLEVNHPEAIVYALLVDERPEEVTHFRRSCHAEVIAASSDQVAKDHVRTTEQAIPQVLEPVLEGKDVVLLLDSITRLARAYNTVRGDSGRTLSGGLDANAMQTPRRLFGAARNIEGGGSLTIIGTALVDTGSRMDEVIFQEFKGTGNTEIVLSRQLFEKRIFPAIDIAKSGTRKEEKLYDPETITLVHKVRRVLSTMPPDRAMEGLLKLMAKHPTNEDLLHALPRS